MTFFFFFLGGGGGGGRCGALINYQLQLYEYMYLESLKSLL